jgi:hypothetical protein
MTSQPEELDRDLRPVGVVETQVVGLASHAGQPEQTEIDRD